MTATHSDEELQLFSSLFKGYEDAHGQYEINKQESSGKMLGRAQTYSRGASESDYRSHLNGVTGIGIIPLLKDDNCWFGAIDIDIKGDVKLQETHEELEAKVRKYELPLMVFRSKSNGVHLYLFGSEPISARLVQARLAEFAALLGYGGCEVFPKQITRLKPTDAGNWINLPLFGNARKAIYEGKELERIEALKLCQYLAKSENELRAFAPKSSNLFTDGPPCLQTLATLGIGEGGRNNILFNVAMYFRLKDEDGWQEQLEQFNEEHVFPPLDKRELQEVAKQSLKKGYNYTCKVAPICNHCDRNACKKRKFGIGASGDNDTHVVLPITDITKFVAGGESYRWGVNTGVAMLEFSSSELLDPSAHRIKFMECLNIVIPNMKPKEFLDQIQALVTKCEVVHDPEDASETGQLVAAIERWFLDKGSVKTSDELIKARWWQSPENGRIYFRGQALQDYLIHQEKIKVRPHQLWRALQANFKAEKDMLLVKGKRRRVWYIEDFVFENDDKLQVPTIEKPMDVL